MTSRIIKELKRTKGHTRVKVPKNCLRMAKKQICEEAFYDHLTIGLVKTLENLPRVSQVQCEKRQPCEKAQVSNWEQRHSVYLPEDMKKFYLSADGFILRWSYQYSVNDLRRVGLIQIPHLTQITLLRENIEIPHVAIQQQMQSLPPLPPLPALKDQWGNMEPVLTLKTKIFELNSVGDVAKVCLVYESTGSNTPKFYLLELHSLQWQLMAETFSEYLRMAIVHLGLPYWELCFSRIGLPSWAEQLFMLLAPHLLEERAPRRNRIITPAPEHPYNTIDQCIFRVKPKSTAKTFTAQKK